MLYSVYSIEYFFNLTPIKKPLPWNYFHRLHPLSQKVKPIAVEFMKKGYDVKHISNNEIYGRKFKL